MRKGEGGPQIGLCSILNANTKKSGIPKRKKKLGQTLLGPFPRLLEISRMEACEVEHMMQLPLCVCVFVWGIKRGNKPFDPN